ncbi:MAG: response regulator, partial [Erysipelotrichia bacterium]|nr:response regulator [Erysipelotrichia bacterium]
MIIIIERRKIKKVVFIHLHQERMRELMTQPTQKKRLLLVDDSEINIIILSKILQKEYELLTAYDGQAAMDILNSADNDSIAAVILDIVMPVMDGFEVLSRMRSDSHLRQLPVIVSSGQDSQPDSSTEIRALSMGANDYVNKPYNPDILKHRIANAIYLHETAAFVNTVQHDSLTGLYSKEYFYLQCI